MYYNKKSSVGSPLITTITTITHYSHHDNYDHHHHCAGIVVAVTLCTFVERSPIHD